MKPQVAPVAHAAAMFAVPISTAPTVAAAPEFRNVRPCCTCFGL